MTKCSVCAQLDNKEDSLLCDSCKLPIHVLCAGLSRPEADCLRSKNRKIIFFCEKCNFIEIDESVKTEICDLKNEINFIDNLLISNLNSDFTEEESITDRDNGRSKKFFNDQSSKNFSRIQHENSKNEKCVRLGSPPEKSKQRYDLAYQKFEKWCEEENVKEVSEKVLLTYFDGRKNQKASTLWALYSMLRSELFLKRNIDIKNYAGLIHFLKRQSDGYCPKKSNVFTKDNIAQFLTKTDDHKFLMAKVALIIGIAGACRKSELTFLRTENVEDRQSYFLVNIPNAETKVRREVAITEGDIEGTNFVEIIRKYINYRPVHVKHDRFFVKYYNGKCSVQPVGINTFGNLAKVIAQTIGLPNPTLFTGHCFRRSSATLLAESGATTLKLKRHGSGAEGCIEGSLKKKKRVGINSLDEFSGVPRSVSQITANSINKTSLSSGINLNNCSNCVINVYNN